MGWVCERVGRMSVSECGRAGGQPMMTSARLYTSPWQALRTEQVDRGERAGALLHNLCVLSVNG